MDLSASFVGVKTLLLQYKKKIRPQAHFAAFAALVFHRAFFCFLGLNPALADRILLAGILPIRTGVCMPHERSRSIFTLYFPAYAGVDIVNLKRFTCKTCFFHMILPQIHPYKAAKNLVKRQGLQQLQTISFFNKMTSTKPLIISLNHT